MLPLLARYLQALLAWDDTLSFDAWNAMCMQWHSPRAATISPEQGGPCCCMPLYAQAAHTHGPPTRMDRPPPSAPPCSSEELERLVEEAEAHRAEDKEILQNSEARQGLETYLYRWGPGQGGVGLGWWGL